MSASLVLQQTLRPRPGARLARRPRGARRGDGRRRRRAPGRAAGRWTGARRGAPWARTGSTCGPRPGRRPISSALAAAVVRARRRPRRRARRVRGTTTVLGPLVRARPRLRILGHPDGFEAAVTTVLGQQVSLAAARTFGGRLAAAYGSPGPDGLTAYPTPERLAAVDPVELQAVVRITHSRARTLHALARGLRRRARARAGSPRRPGPAPRPARDRPVDRGLPRAARAGRPRRDARGRPRAAPGARRRIGARRSPGWPSGGARCAPSRRSISGPRPRTCSEQRERGPVSARSRFGAASVDAVTVESQPTRSLARGPTFTAMKPTTSRPAPTVRARTTRLVVAGVIALAATLSACSAGQR